MLKKYNKNIKKSPSSPFSKGGNHSIPLFGKEGLGEIYSLYLPTFLRRSL
jgi:hypothetical protein